MLIFLIGILSGLRVRRRHWQDIAQTLRGRPDPQSQPLEIAGDLGPTHPLQAEQTLRTQGERHAQGFDAAHGSQHGAEGQRHEADTETEAGGHGVEEARNVGGSGSATLKAPVRSRSTMRAIASQTSSTWTVCSGCAPPPKIGTTRSRRMLSRSCWNKPWPSRPMIKPGRTMASRAGSNSASSACLLRA